MPKKGDALTPMNDEDRIPSYKKKIQYQADKWCEERKYELRDYLLIQYEILTSILIRIV